MILVTFSEYFVWVTNTGVFCWDIICWIFTPSIAPWVGVLAALASAITIDTKRWISSLSTFFVRSLRVIITWLIIIHCLRNLPGGRGEGNHGKYKGNGKIKHSNPETVFPTPITVDGKKVDLMIGFPVDPVNPNRGKAFSCDILISKKNKKSLTGINNIDLLNQLLKELTDVKKVSNEKSNTYLVYIKMTFNPGDSVLNQIEERIKQIQPDASFVRGE